MSFYDTWFYRYILNSTWMIWSIVVIVFGVNLIMPVLLWFLFGSKKESNP